MRIVYIYSLLLCFGGLPAFLSLMSSKSPSWITKLLPIFFAGSLPEVIKA